jgi:L-alanine-DL-glutamate epimerase-like enolase superfamily enzyme
VKLQITSATYKLTSPLRTSYGTVRERELITVALTDDEGVTGWGEAAPLPAYDGVEPGSVRSALDAYAVELARAPRGASGAELLDLCRRAHDLPAALAAIDMALWDRAGRRMGLPVARLLVDDPAQAVPVNATIAAADRAGVASEVAGAVRAGFRCIKLKAGIGDDAGRVAAARAAGGPDVALRLDANGAWSVEEAVAAIGALAPAGLELVEEPVRGVRAVAAVRDRVPVRVAIDESAGEPGALSSGAADAVCLKLSRCGGVGALLAAAALVRASGSEVYLASSLDGPLGIAAAVHAAAALAARGPLPPCGLATLELLGLEHDDLAVRDGAITLPAGPGLGLCPSAEM